MQSIPHSMAHRGAGATRTNARWHPYTPPRAPVAGASTPSYALLASSSSHHQHPNSQESTYLITPAASVYTISPAVSTFSQSPHPLSSALQQAVPQPLKQPQVQKTHPAKANYVASLVDQAVKSLTDIWRPESIPVVFSTQTDITVVTKQPPSLPSQRQPLKRQLVQLPSPCSPSTLSSPLPPAPSDPPHASTSTSAVFPSAFLAEHFGSNAATVVSEKDLVPIKTFVQEVLRRSRTTCSVLQSALCYIEAVRGKVPELAEKEKLGTGVRGEPELDKRIVKEDEASASSKANTTLDTSNLCGLPTELMSMDPFDASCVPTVLQMDASLPLTQQMQTQRQSNDKRRKIPAKPLTPLPPLPSPLLCPRRTFLAALILASKFLQDRCYSNRAWAKLSGLPPREVGRCERALGDALGWRLWVGKSSTPPQEENSRSMQRTKSEGTVAFGSSPVSAMRNAMHFPSPPLSDAGASPEFGRAQTKAGMANRALRRAATLPDDAAMRSVPPRYRSPGSLPFSFAGPPLAVIVAHQHAALSAQQTLLSSAFTSQTPLSSDPTPVPLEEPTPRLSYSPLSLGESTLETPSAASCSYSYNYNFNNGANGVWSPAQSTGSNDSSDSGSSIGSEAIATPPDMPTAVRLAGVSVDGAQGDTMGSGLGAAKGHRFVPADVPDPVAWYAQVLSTGGLGNGTAIGSMGGIGNGNGIDGGQASVSMSMLDSLTTADLGLGLGLGGHV